MAHIDSGLEMRGGQRQALLLMRGLRERGHECELLARPATPIWEAARALGLEVRAMSLGAIRACTKAADLVHAHDAHAHTLAAIAARKPMVVSRRVAFPVKRGLLSRWKYGRARRYLAVSQYVAEELARSGVPREKIDVVYDGVERSAAREAGAAEAFRVVALGTKDPAKGRGLLEQAAREADIEIVFSDDLARDLPGAAVFVYATRSEGLGSAALFAMSLEVAVVASRVGGLPEVVQNEQTGLLVANTVEEFAQALTRLRGNRELRERLAREGRMRVEAEFTAAQMVDRTLASYARALGESR